MQRTNINPEIFQDMLAAASNAADKGQSQFFTPTPWAQALALPLPRCRYAVTDLNCGTGHLLQGAANKTTQHLIGADIDPCRNATHPPVLAPAAKLHRLTADATLLYPMLVEIDWHADLWALNPPWNLGFWRSPDRLGALAQSDLPAVRQTFAAPSGGTIPADAIDSTIAMLLIALDRSTDAGEGFLIANNATLDRLIFSPNAPHQALARHIWARLTIQGNPMTGINAASFQPDGFQTGVIYFARDHTSGPAAILFAVDLPEATAAAQSLASRRDNLSGARTGARIIDTFQVHKESIPLWRAATDEWNARQQPVRTDYNLSLTPDGSIRASLNLYEENSSRILKQEAAKLYELHGRRPMQLVLQRSQREMLLRLCNLPIGNRGGDGSSPWRVQPALQEAVRKAVREYHASRAPLYPLPGLQRLGYLEEEDSIECKQDLWDAEHATPLFLQGQRYPLTTRSVRVIRTGWKPNLAAEMEQVEYSGSELATYITDETGASRCFMEARLINDNTSIDGFNAADKIDFTLQQLDTHFIIPSVPDIATIDPDRFQRNLALLDQLETLINQF